MKSSLLTRLWHSSPASLTRALQRRLERRQCKPGWFTVRAGPLKGLELFLPNDRVGDLAAMVAGTFDAFLYDALLKRRKLEAAVCWDVGAHIGYHSLGFAALGAEVLCFEPNPANAARLKLHLERNQPLACRVRHLGVALSDGDGEMTFMQDTNLDRGSTGSHLMGVKTPLRNESYATFERVTVPTLRIDSLIEERGERPPEVIKIDVEGAEALVLRGGARFFADGHPIILMEVHHIRAMAEVQHLLDGWGYRVEILEDDESSASRCFLLARREV